MTGTVEWLKVRRSLSMICHANKCISLSSSSITDLGYSLHGNKIAGLARSLINTALAYVSTDLLLCIHRHTWNLGLGKSLCCSSTWQDTLSRMKTSTPFQGWAEVVCAYIWCIPWHCFQASKCVYKSTITVTYNIMPSFPPTKYWMKIASVCVSNLLPGYVQYSLFWMVSKLWMREVGGSCVRLCSKLRVWCMCNQSIGCFDQIKCVPNSSGSRLHFKNKY